MIDHRDMALADQAQQICDLEHALVIYRELVVAGIDEIAAVRTQLERLRKTHHRLIDDFRRLRETILEKVA